jgi:hypothetical protein
MAGTASKRAAAVEPPRALDTLTKFMNAHPP